MESDRRSVCHPPQGGIKEASAATTFFIKSRRLLDIIHSSGMAYHPPRRGGISSPKVYIIKAQALHFVASSAVVAFF